MLTHTTTPPVEPGPLHLESSVNSLVIAPLTREKLSESKTMTEFHQKL